MRGQYEIAAVGIDKAILRAWSFRHCRELLKRLGFSTLHSDPTCQNK